MALIKDAGPRGQYEKLLMSRGKKIIAGVDEAGRGPCAGPLVVAAVILKEIFHKDNNQIQDSKKIRENQREPIYQYILENCLSYQILVISNDDIDKNGLQNSNIGGMKKVASELSIKPEHVIFDGYKIEDFELPSDGIWQGDQSCISVAAASILAKVTRDKIMIEMDQKYPGYGFAKHKGYSAPAHMQAIAKLGLTPIHRKSFANIKEFIK